MNKSRFDQELVKKCSGISEELLGKDSENYSKKRKMTKLLIALIFMRGRAFLGALFTKKGP